MDISTLGLNIKRVREHKNISAYQLSKIAGVGGATISQIESGKRQTLKGDTIEKIAHALNVSVNELLCDGENNIDFETNDFCDLMSIILNSDTLELDGTKLNKQEKVLLQTNLTMFINSIRYMREKTGNK